MVISDFIAKNMLFISREDVYRLEKVTLLILADDLTLERTKEPSFNSLVVTLEMDCFLEKKSYFQGLESFFRILKIILSES